MTEKTEERSYNARKWYGWFWVAVVLAVTGLYLYYLYPDRGIGPQQPIYFSHRVHAGVKAIDCRFCHGFVEQGEHAGIPVMQKCFFCHEYIIPLHPQIVKEREHYTTKNPVPWVRIFYVPDHVQFKHQPHVKWAKLDCTNCHGNVAEKDRLVQVDFKMQFCITCHRERNAQLDCWLACHH